MEKDRDYYTVRGYQSNNPIENLSTAMEDYLEMIARFCRENGRARIGELSAALHVKPSSASKMVSKLRDAGFVFLDANSNIYMTGMGKETAAYLLYRHETIEAFLKTIGSEDPLKEAELIEHFLSPHTVYLIKKIIPIVQEGKRNTFD